jgi:hypothetical protein
MDGLLALLFLTAVVLAGASGSSTPAPQRTGSYHWHRPHAVNRQYYFEPDGQSPDGYQQLKCPFCEITYVNRG